MSSQNKLQVVDYFGPRVAKVKLDDDIVKQLQSMIMDANEPFNDRLLGFLKEEVNLYDQIMSNKQVHDTLLANMNEYLYDIDSGVWKEAIHSGSLPTALEMTAAWYNKQIAGEHQPPHHHTFSADLVCVIFAHIKLDNDESKYYNVSHGEKQKGQLNLEYGEVEKNGFGRPRIYKEPEEGDMYIFPGTLTHYTTPVVGNSERYSVACNYSITPLVKRLQGKLLRGEHGF